MDFDDLMPCGECDRCGEYLDHSEAWFCEKCNYGIHGSCRDEDGDCPNCGWQDKYEY